MPMEEVRRYFGEAELKKLHAELVVAVGEVRKLRIEKKQTSTVQATAVLGAEKIVYDVQERLSKGYEMVEVETGELMDTPSPGVKRIIRMDTSDTLREVPMSPEERQRSLFDEQHDDPGGDS